MTRDWNQLEGVSLAGRYFLKQCLRSTVHDAWYLTRFGAECDAAIRLVLADHPSARAMLRNWEAARALDHPHIARMLDAGVVEVDGTDVIYAVCEYPDEILSSVIAERPLDAGEAGEVLSACLSALEFLHGQGLVHSAVSTDRIMAVGDRIKLMPDPIHPAGGAAPGFESRPYDAPEVALGTGVTPAADMWSLGCTLVEILTQRPPAPGTAATLSEPFASIVRHTLVPSPAQRWALDDVRSFLTPPPREAPPEVAEPQTEPAPEPQPVIGPPRAEPAAVAAPARQGLPMKWVPVAGVIAAAALGAIFLPHSKQPAAKAPAPIAAAPAPAAPPTVSTPPPRKAVANPSAVWRVIVYEYSRRGYAEQKTHEINRKHPNWHAEVFAPAGNRAPYFVALGGRMTRSEAERLRRQARAAGAPSDTFVRNYPR